jgi:DNA-binding transcriptional LysR family regulator
MRFPSQKHLRVFEAVGRLGGVRQAAAELGLDHSVASRHLKLLQEELGIALVDVSPRGVRLTETGKRYHCAVSSALAELTVATENVRREARPHHLVVWSIPGFALRWLTPRLESFHRAHPTIDLTVRSTDIALGLMRAEADLAIDYGRIQAPGLRTVELANPRVFPVASPSWIVRHRHVRSPQDLLRVPLIHQESERQWRVWLETVGVTPPTTIAGPRLWHAHLAIEAAKRGQGVALANELISGDDLTDGSLIEIGSSDVHLLPYTLAVRADRWTHAPVEKFRSWLTRILGKP